MTTFDQDCNDNWQRWTKVSYDFKANLIYIYVEYILRFSHLQSCKLLTSCGCQPWTGPELFANKIILFPCNFTRTDRNQVINNKTGETMSGEVIVMLGCVKMAYLDVLSRDRSRNVSIRSASVHSRINTVLNRCVTLIIRSVTVLFYECVTVERN